jgi:hypothetical protein
VTSGRILHVGGWIATAFGLGDLVLHSLTRRTLTMWLGSATPSPIWVALTLVGVGALSLLVVRRRRRTPSVAVFAALLAAGLAAQLQLGARLQSDGFYYYAFARSMWFDHDVDLTNDYRLLGLDDAQHAFLFEPTITGHAQTAWAIGPAIAWSPFVGLGHAAAHALAATGADVKTDGTSFPYRQAVCLAGLFYGLLGLFWAYRLTRAVFNARTSLAAVASVGLGSFVLWYLVREPTMSHAVSMAAVAGFVLAWTRVRTREGRLPWLLLGVAGGLMTAIRWQNAILLLLPAVSLVTRVRHHPSAWPAWGRQVAVFGAGVLAGVLPQLLAWRAIYGSLLATSPVGPQMFWWHPQVVDLLWSSRSGLFATSPALYVAAIGLVLLWRHDRRLAVAGLVMFALMIWTNAAVEDWWGGASFGMRRFDSLVPFFVVGTGASLAALTRAVRTRPGVAVAAALALLVVWNVTLMAVARSGAYRIGQPVSFGDLGARQADVLHQWIGHVSSAPANLLFGARYGVAPWRYDVLGPGRFLGDPARPYGRIDVGADTDAPYIGDGWHGRENDGEITFRWATASVALLIPLDHAADLVVQMQARPFDIPDAPEQTVSVDIDGRTAGVAAVGTGWHRVDVPVPAAFWHAGVNHLVLRFAREASPADLGGTDGRRLAAAVDYVRIEVRSGR